MPYPYVPEAQQQALKAIGFYDGAIDHELGPKTAAAIARCAELQTDLKRCGFYEGKIDSWPGPLTLRAMDECARLQTWLNNHGYDVGPVDKWSGDRFRAGLKAFQHDACIAEDSIYGPITANAMAHWGRPPAQVSAPAPLRASYPIVEKLIRHNRPGTALKVQGLVIHDTDDPGATDEGIDAYFNSGERDASAHYAIDWDSITRMIPEREIAWHAGPTANRRFLSIEMCVPSTHNQREFQEIWNRTVFLAADICKRYGISVDKIYSHNMISNMFRETDHTDPDGFFAEYGKNFADFRAAVQAELE